MIDEKLSEIKGMIDETDKMISEEVGEGEPYYGEYFEKKRYVISHRDLDKLMVEISSNFRDKNGKPLYIDILSRFKEVINELTE